MEVMTTRSTAFRPPQSETAWAAARERVERYLRAHRVGDVAEISRLTDDIIGIARARARPGVEPLTLAMETLDACINEWLARLLPAPDATEASVRPTARLALTQGEVPARWPAHFLRESEAPAELRQTLRATPMERAPEIRFTNMAPKVIRTSSARARLGGPANSRRPLLRWLSPLWIAVSRIGAVLTLGGW